jgi:voltage-gated sodium channel
VTKLFGAGFPDWFGDFGNSAYSLFQVMTLESWSMGIVRPVMEVYP